jgi:hypothetical protein
VSVSSAVFCFSLSGEKKWVVPDGKPGGKKETRGMIPLPNCCSRALSVCTRAGVAVVCALCFQLLCTQCCPLEMCLFFSYKHSKWSLLKKAEYIVSPQKRRKSNISISCAYNSQSTPSMYLNQKKCVEK